MKILLQKAKIIDTSSTFHNKEVDVLIENGVITKMEASIPNNPDYTRINHKNLHLSKGWFDTSVCFGEPGFEDRETIKNGLDVAAKSGFTNIALQPNTQPVIDNQSHIYFVKQKAQNCATNLHPIGAFTTNSDGQSMAEMYDMKNAGAVAFGDYNKNIANANLLKIGLQYTQDFNGLLYTFCQDENLKGNGTVNEGEVSTKLGLKGIAPLAEEISIARNLAILEYTGGKLHIPTISSAGSVKLIQEAKAKKMQVTCGVAVHNLIFNDQKINTFNTNFKVMPPLRTEFDQQALIEGVLNNTIDTITSDHNPIDIEHKKVEFDFAKNGTIGLESAYGALQTVLPIEKIIEKLTFGYQLFQIKCSSIEVGNIANITLFENESNWFFEEENILSKSKNSAFLGQKMIGKVLGIINNNQFIYNYGK